MKIVKITFAFLLFLGIIASNNVSATTYVTELVNGIEILVGVKNVQVKDNQLNPWKYFDIKFVDGLVEDIWTGRPEYVFDFDSSTVGRATWALQNEVFINSNKWDLFPNLTLGIGSSSFGQILTPYSADGADNLGRQNIRYGYFHNTNSFRDPTIGIGMLSSEWDLATDDFKVWAVWTEVAPVPVPSTIILLGIGLLGMAGINRKRVNQ